MHEDDLLAASYIILLLSIMSMILYNRYEVYAISAWIVSIVSAIVSSSRIVYMLWKDDDD